MESLNDIVKKMEDAIFSYDIKGFQEIFNQFSTEIEQLSRGISEENLAKSNQILHHIMTAIVNKDYLLIADLARYELLPIFICTH